MYSIVVDLGVEKTIEIARLLWVKKRKWLFIDIGNSMAHGHRLRCPIGGSESKPYLAPF